MKPTKQSFALTTVDLVTIGVNTFLALMHFIFASDTTNLFLGLGFLAATGVTLVFAAADARGVIRRGTVLHFLRLFHVQALYAPYFMRVIALSQLVWGGQSFDSLFFRMEEAVFGVQLALVLPERFGHLRALNELIFFAYFAFYALLCLPGWILYLKRRYREAERALFTITASFGLLYVWYVFFPVHGPKYYIDELYARWYQDLDGYFFSWLMRSIFEDANLAGAAVPSSHVAISTIATILVGRSMPRLLLAFAPITAVLYVSTVYIYAHYAVDVLLGLAVVPLLLWASRALSSRLEQRLCAGRPAEVERKTAAGNRTSRLRRTAS